MNTRMAAMGLVTLVIVVGASVLGTLRWAAAVGPDVDNSGKVLVNDILEVVHHYYEDVPTPKPVPSIVGDRQWVYLPSYPNCCGLLNTSDGSIVTTLSAPYGPTGLSVEDSSCDGHYAYLRKRISDSQQVLLFVDQKTGAVLVESSPLGHSLPATVLFPCPLAGMGGEFLTGQPAEKRAVTRVLDGATPGGTLTIWNLETGQPTFVGANLGGQKLNCTNDTLMYTDAVTTKLKLVRLLDAAVTDVLTSDQYLTNPFGGC